MDAGHPLSSLIVVQSLDLKKKTVFRPCDEGGGMFGLETLYLTNCNRLDIVFAVNILAIFSAKPTKWRQI